MEGTESKSPTQQEDAQITIAENIAGYVEFQECVEGILEEIQADENFPEMSVENYEKKKSYLRKNLNKVSRLHTLLFDKHVHLIDEVGKNGPSLSSDSGSEAKRLLEDESKSQKQVADLRQVISESDLKIKTLEKELETSRKSLSISKDTISILKGEKSSSKLFQENQILKYELQLSQTTVEKVSKQLNSQNEQIRRCQNEVESYAAASASREDQIKKLKSKNDRCKSDITRLEEILKSKEEIWNHDVSNLKLQLKNQTKSIDDLKKQLNFSRSERNKISGKMDTLEKEKTSKDKLIQELETRLNELQVEHEGVVSSFEDAEKLKKELRLKVEELEREVGRQTEVISVTAEEKLEAIRQLSFSLEYYMSKYKQLHQSSAANKTGCFLFLSGQNT